MVNFTNPLIPKIYNALKTNPQGLTNQQLTEMIGESTQYTCARLSRDGLISNINPQYSPSTYVLVEEENMPEDELYALLEATGKDTFSTYEIEKLCRLNLNLPDYDFNSGLQVLLRLGHLSHPHNGTWKLNKSHTPSPTHSIQDLLGVAQRAAQDLKDALSEKEIATQILSEANAKLNKAQKASTNANNTLRSALHEMGVIL